MSSALAGFLPTQICFVMLGVSAGAHCGTWGRGARLLKLAGWAAGRCWLAGCGGAGSAAAARGGLLAL